MITESSSGFSTKIRYDIVINNNIISVISDGLDILIKYLARRVIFNEKFNGTRRIHPLLIVQY